jgi:hypothetical protein
MVVHVHTDLFLVHVHTDYMIAFENSVWMYYIKKLNNGEYPKDKSICQSDTASSVLSNPFGLSLLWVLRL